MALKPLQIQPERGGIKLARKTTPVDMTWRPSWLMAAPHRLAFFAGALMLGVSAVWWLVMLTLRATSLAAPWVYAPATAHSVVMSFSFMPLFFAGFLFTAGPRWLDRPEIPAQTLLPYVVLAVVGWCICLPGLHASTLIAATGMASVALAWSALTVHFIQLWWLSKVADKVHATVVVCASIYGALAMWLVVFGLFTEQDHLIRVATQSALWIFIATVFAAVSHRMIPFFSASALPILDTWHPMWLLWIMVGVLWFEGVFVALDTTAATPTAELMHWMQVAVEVPASALMIWLAIRWGLVQSLKIRLLAMLHGGFLWLGIALALHAISHAMLAASQGQASLGLAPTHAMTMGYLGATMMQWLHALPVAIAADRWQPTT